MFLAPPGLGRSFFRSPFAVCLGALEAKLPRELTAACSVEWAHPFRPRGSVRERQLRSNSQGCGQTQQYGVPQPQLTHEAAPECLTLLTGLQNQAGLIEG